MVADNQDKRLEIKKGQFWELWLISPTIEAVLGIFKTLEDLNQAQITLYDAWEKPNLSREGSLSQIRQ